MELKALSRGGSEGSASVRRSKRVKRSVALKSKRKTTSKRARAKSARAEWGAVYLDASAFAELEKCIQEPQRPTPSILKGAALIQSLYGSKKPR